MYAKSRFCFFVCVLFLASLPVQAKGFKPHVHPKIVADLKEGHLSNKIRIGVLFEIDPGWHIYWINPGDAGIPTTVKWKSSHDIHFSPISYPAPETFVTPEIVSYGYSGKTILLSDLSVANLSEAKTFSIEAKVEWLACKDVCIPGKAVLNRDLKLNHPKNSKEDTRLIAEFENKIPKAPVNWGMYSYFSDRRVLLVLKSQHQFPKFHNVQFYPNSSTLFKHTPSAKFKQTDSRLEIILERSKLQSGAISLIQGVLKLEGPTSESYLIDTKPEQKEISEF